MVSIHAPARGATCVEAALARATQFQSTRPHGARRPRRGAPWRWPWGFNPRARTGRDFPDAGLLATMDVSIHAPARGATVQTGRSGVARGVSIHAPARGATGLLRHSDRFAPRFNPRARTVRDRGPVATEVPQIQFQSTRPHGARPRNLPTVPRIVPVSIHAPARGATYNLLLHHYYSCVSIHAPARGATCNLVRGCVDVHVSIHAPARGATSYDTATKTLVMFQSTRPHGARPRIPPSVSSAHSFQSTRPHGARQLFTIGRTSPAMFQSTRPHGARPVIPIKPPPTGLVSIHAPARGATVYKKGAQMGFTVSIHAPARGAT